MTNEPRESRCGARTRAGHPCKKWALSGRSRCRNHGGCSTGPRTIEGKARVNRNALKHGFRSQEFRDVLAQSKALITRFSETLQSAA